MTQANNQTSTTGSESCNTMTGKVTGFHKNCLGTLSFEGKFLKMRKAQEFDCYPMRDETETDRVRIQSETRIGWIVLATGDVLLCPPKASGAYFPDLAHVVKVDQLSGSDLMMFKAQIFATASAKAGTHGVTVNNSGAAQIFAGALL